MGRYHLRCLCREVAYSVRNPRRKDWFELPYAVHCVWTDIARPFKKPVWFIQKVWDYRRILWRDCDWDYGFMLDLWEKKFRNMHAHTSRHIAKIAVIAKIERQPQKPKTALPRISAKEREFF